jgi:hypothetical protein
LGLGGCDGGGELGRMIRLDPTANTA